MTVIKSARLRRLLRFALPLVVLPAVALCGATVFRDKSYAYVCLAVSALAILLFFCGFEKKQTGARRIILVAVMTALAVAGRFVTMPFPGFNPVSAVAVIAAMYLGCEAGFLVGSLSAVISNVFAGNGVWTPFQMLAWGLVGFFAGLLAPWLKRNRAVLCAYGAAAGLVYSLIMDVWTVLWYNNSFKLSLFLAAVATAAPYTAIYSASNIVFLLLMAKPFGEKLGRIKIKYGV